MNQPTTVPSTGPSAAPPVEATDAASTPSPSPVPKKIYPSPNAVLAMAGIALVGILLILWAWKLWPFQSSTMTTDNSYVRGQITVLSPQVNGYVTRVLVSDFQHVKAGEPLIEIDQRIYAEKIAQARAQLANAQAQLANAQQTQTQNRALLGSRRASLAAADAEQLRAQTELRRVEELAAKGSVSLNERDRVRTSERLAQANVLKARADIDMAEQQIKSTQVSREGLQAQVKLAEAQLALAEIDLANTTIRAPRDGQVSEASVRPGQYVAAGSQLLFLVPDTLWVVANFKEDQTYAMRIGQHARFSVDALEGQQLSGTVQEIAPATGSEFSVLRPDNASGNFTKVVQRLPVRIAIDPDQPLARRLRPGMSVVVRVDTEAKGTS